MATYAISPMIRRQIAAAMVRESHPGYDRQHMGQSYAVALGQNDTLNAVFFKEATAQWDPWPDNAQAVPVAALYQGSDADFGEVEEGFEDDAVFFAASELPELYEEVDAESFAALMVEAAEVEAAQRAEYSEAGMGMGQVFVGGQPATTTVHAAQGQRLARAYNALIEGEYPSGTALTAEDRQVELRFLRAWIKPEFVPAS